MILIVYKQVFQTFPVLLAIESIQMYFATTPDERGIVEWSKMLIVFILVII